MKVIGFTIIWGDQWKRQGQRVLDIWSKHHGGAETILIDLSHESNKLTKLYSRAKILDSIDFGDIAIYMDADTVCVGNMLCDNEFKEEDELGLVVDGNLGEIRKQESRIIGLAADNYYNAGMMIIRKTEGTVNLFREWWEGRDVVYGVYNDQSALNHHIRRLRFPIKVMSPAYNWFMLYNWVYEGVKLLHWAGVESRKRDREIIVYIEKESRRLREAR